MIYSNDNYYEATLQIRPYNQEVIDFVKKQIDNDKKALISSEIKTKNGLDLKLNSNKFLMQISRKLKNRFKGSITVSRSLYGINHQTSKQVYRLTVCFRLAKAL